MLVSLNPGDAIASPAICTFALAQDVCNLKIFKQYQQKNMSSQHLLERPVLFTK
jgi:hypothetical protein